MFSFVLQTETPAPPSFIPLYGKLSNLDYLQLLIKNSNGLLDLEFTLRSEFSFKTISNVIEQLQTIGIKVICTLILPQKLFPKNKVISITYFDEE